MRNADKCWCFAVNRQSLIVTRQVISGGFGLFPEADGLFPGADGLFPEADGLFPEADGLFPEADGLFPEADGLFPGDKRCCLAGNVPIALNIKRFGPGRWRAIPKKIHN
ncbi:MAG: hypothetical protein ABL999_18175 [Pyrinomonadaceae bacterium]